MAVKTSGSSRSARAQLAEYRRKRDFGRTGEPSGETTSTATRPGRLRFVIQKHAARNLHFDLRLELDGVMKSWAVPKGPSLDPSAKRLAMEVEDHPVEYGGVEGGIPQSEDGGGPGVVLGHGTDQPHADDGRQGGRGRPRGLPPPGQKLHGGGGV